MHSGSANVILRNNRNLLKRKKREKFVRIPGKYEDVEKDRFDHVVLKPEVLKDIRERLQKERKQRVKRQIALFVIMLVLLLGLLLF